MKILVLCILVQVGPFMRRLNKWGWALISTHILVSTLLPFPGLEKEKRDRWNVEGERDRDRAVESDRGRHIFGWRGGSIWHAVSDGWEVLGWSCSQENKGRTGKWRQRLNGKNMWLFQCCFVIVGEGVFKIFTAKVKEFWREIWGKGYAV